VAYAASTDVDARIAQLTATAAGTKPNSTQVTLLLNAASAKLDHALSINSVTPIPFTSDGSGEQDAFLAVLLDLNACKATADTLRSRAIDATGPDDKPAWEYWLDCWTAGYDLLLSGDGIPAAVVSSGGSATPTTNLVENPSVEPDFEANENPAFKRRHSNISDVTF